MRFRLSNGLAMGYRTSGAGRVLVLLHPIGTGGQFWDEMSAHLVGNYRCLAVDFRGYGDSDTPATKFTLDDLADDVIEFLRAQEIRDCVVIGCSMGGMVAQGIALKAPELLAGLVLTGTISEQSEESRKIPLRRAVDTLKGMPPLIEETLGRWFPRDYLSANGPIVERVRGWLKELDPVVFSWGWEAIAGLNYGARLSAVSMPALLIRGSEDPAGRTMPEMAKLMRRSQFVEIAKAGHMAPMQFSKEFADLLRAFIDKDVGK